MEARSKQNKTELTSQASWLIPLTLIAVLVALYFLLPSFQQFINTAYTLLREGDQNGFETWIQGFGAWGVVVILAVMLLQTLLAFIPSILIMVVSVLAYGPWWGSVISFIGLLIAASMAYIIGRSLGPVTLYKLIGEKTENKVESFVDNYGSWTIVAARISPILSTDAVSFVAGLVKMRFFTFILATAMGTLPLIILIAFLGSSIERLKGGMIVVAILSLSLLLIYIIVDKRKKASN